LGKIINLELLFLNHQAGGMICLKKSQKNNNMSECKLCLAIFVQCIRESLRMVAIATALILRVSDGVTYTFEDNL